MTRFITQITIFAAFLITQSLSAFAVVPKGDIPYYGAAFYRDMNAGMKDKVLLQRLNLILKLKHSVIPNDYDVISPTCQSRSCYDKVVLGYNGARKFLLGEFYLIKTPTGYGVHDVYCDHDAGPEQFPHGEAPGPGIIPDGNVINTEHTWPQSLFTSRYPNEMQKSDLHHLFPTDNQMNSVRGNYPFGEVVADLKPLKCSNVRFGRSDLGESQAFEPPAEHKGNVARAIFYFSVRYEMSIDSKEEATLRKWHKEDPVDEVEYRLNNRIFEVQHDRNPFIDYPNLVDRVSDF